MHGILLNISLFDIGGLRVHGMQINCQARKEGWMKKEGWKMDNVWWRTEGWSASRVKAKHRYLLGNRVNWCRE
jgi:hypothetical protein